jgi:hypothetical protein
LTSPASLQSHERLSPLGCLAGAGGGGAVFWLYWRWLSPAAPLVFAVFFSLMLCLLVLAVLGGIWQLLTQGFSRARLGEVAPIALVCAVGHGLALAMLAIAAHSAPSLQVLTQAGDIAELERRLARGDDPNGLGRVGVPPLAFATDPALVALLLRYGADANARDNDGDPVLSEAARRGDVVVVQQLIAAGADLEARSLDFERTALEEALDSDHPEVAALLRRAGARDPTVTAANGRPLGSGDPPVRVAKAYNEAIRVRDGVAIGGLTTHAGRFLAGSDVEWSEWRTIRPALLELAAGYWNEGAATLALRGQDAAGSWITWRFQLVRVTAEAAPEAGDGVWLVERSSWVTAPSASEPAQNGPADRR